MRQILALGWKILSSMSCYSAQPIVTSSSSSNFQSLNQALGVHGVSLNRVKELVFRSPQSVKEIRTDGRLPVHSAIFNLQSDEIVRFLIDTYPEALLIANDEGQLPIHEAIFFGDLNYETIIYMAELCPESLCVQDKYSYLPIHYACLRRAKSEVIDVLVKLHPEGLTVQSVDGKLPIHIAAKRMKSGDIATMLKAYPESINIKDKSGNLFIHYACMCSNNCNVLSDLFDLHPEQLNIEASDGSLPIHLACTVRDFNEELIIKMATSCQQSLLSGELPINLIVKHRSLSSIMRLIPTLIHLCPESVHFRVNDENSLDVAKRFYSKQSAYRFLLNSSPKNLTDCEHISNYHALNWKTRSSLIFLMSKLSERGEHVNTSGIENILGAINRRGASQFSDEGHIYFRTILSFL